MKKASFEQLYAILLPWLDVEFLPGGGGETWASFHVHHKLEDPPEHCTAR